MIRAAMGPATYAAGLRASSDIQCVRASKDMPIALPLPISPDQMSLMERALPGYGKEKEKANKCDAVSNHIAEQSRREQSRAEHRRESIA
ncbi:hypothetical protein NHQ30_005381 [Ciborinia camelliae]|nr:hypothetical protein NHQ30_005381 [Ciborinia camelliae]